MTLAPVLALVALFTLFPFGYAAWTSVHRHVLVLQDRPYVGLRNYTNAIEDPLFADAIKSSLIFALVAVPLVTLVGLLVALLLNQRVRGFGILLVLVLLPWSIPTVSAGIMWRLLLHGDFGAIDGFLYRIGAIDSYIQWLSGSDLAMASVIVVHTWREFPLPPSSSWPGSRRSRPSSPRPPGSTAQARGSAFAMSPCRCSRRRS